MNFYFKIEYFYFSQNENPPSKPPKGPNLSGFNSWMTFVIQFVVEG